MIPNAQATEVRWRNRTTYHFMPMPQTKQSRG